VLVVERGRIVQRGTPAELAAAEGPFQRLAGALETPADLPAADAGARRSAVSARGRR
jgi:hypothetical protein